MSSHVHMRSITIVSAVWTDYSRFIVPADIEVLNTLVAHSFQIEQREKMILTPFLHLQNSPLLLLIHHCLESIA